MAKKTFEVTINPTPFTVTVEASKPQGAMNKAHRQWRDEVAKHPEKLDIQVNRANTVDVINDDTEESTEE